MHRLNYPMFDHHLTGPFRHEGGSLGVIPQSLPWGFVYCQMMWAWQNVERPGIKEALQRHAPEVWKSTWVKCATFGL